MTKQTLDNPAERSLTREDLTPLGGFSTNDPPLQLEVQSNSLRIVPNKWTMRYVFITTVGIASFFIGFWFMIDLFVVREEQLGGKIICVLIAILTVGGFVGISIWRHRYLLDRSPLVEVDLINSQVSILNGRHTFELSEIVCLIAFSHMTETAESPSSEMQLITERNGQREQFLIIGSPFGAAWAGFGKVLIPFARQCKFPVIIAEAQGSGSGELPLTPL